KVTPEMQNEWIYGYGREERPADEVAEEWIKNNLKVVDLWVYGIKSVDGGRARDAIREAIK
ncbi:glycine/betaine ABC transporter substrate-binding protein, partial [Candidatus Aerophobetes bacterium]|nr:glycine/betaine ABC transporter substrate-binding protein [Candidatus Aerophobetes bacterium]